MTCEFVFLPVGNADSMIIYPDGGSAIVIDLNKMILLQWFTLVAKYRFPIHQPKL